MDNDAIKQNLWGEITKQWGETPPTDNVQLKTQILKRTWRMLNMRPFKL